MENFLENFRKTKLITESTYQRYHKSRKNSVRVNAKCDIQIPKPQDLFPEEEFTNYRYVAVVTDDQTLSFPYHYPKTLSEYIP